MHRVKAQSATEFLIQYSWAIIILVVALSAVVLIATAQHQESVTPSYCYISPELNCYQTIVAVNAQSSNITTYFTNTQTKPIILTGYTIAPSSTSSYYSGTCNVTSLAPGQNAQCTSTIQGFVPPDGSQLNPVFYIQYKICNGSCSSNQSQTPVSTAGIAVVTTGAKPFTASTTVLVSSSTTLVSSSTLSSSSSTLSSSTLSSSSSISSTLSSSSSTLSSSTLSSSTLSSTTTDESTTTIQYYTVTMQLTPALADTYWEACFAYTGVGQSCSANGQSSFSVQVPAGDQITYLCTAPNYNNSGEYSTLGFSNGYSTSNGCPGTFSGPTVTGPMTIQANYQLNTYTVELVESPSEAANYYGACVAFTEANGTAIGQGTCAGPAANGGSGDTYTVSVPVGSTITYLCTAGWQDGGGPYSFSSGGYWSGSVSSSTDYCGTGNGGSPNIAVTGDMTIYANYADIYDYNCGDPGAINEGGGWYGPYDIQTMGNTPIASPAYVLIPYYGLGSYNGYNPAPGGGSFTYSSGTFTYDWQSDSRSSENIYYGSFYLEVQNPSTGCWGAISGSSEPAAAYPTLVNGYESYSPDPDPVIQSNAGQGGPAATFQWTETGLPGGNYRVLGYIYVHPNGGGGSSGWVILSSYSSTVTT